MRLLRAGTERRLTPRRLEPVGLENTLQRLCGGTTASATTTTDGCRDFGHFVLTQESFTGGERNKHTQSKWTLLQLDVLLDLSWSAVD